MPEQAIGDGHLATEMDAAAESFMSASASGDHLTGQTGGIKAPPTTAVAVRQATREVSNRRYCPLGSKCRA